MKPRRYLGTLKAWAQKDALINHFQILIFESPNKKCRDLQDILLEFYHLNHLI